MATFYFACVYITTLLVFFPGCSASYSEYHHSLASTGGRIVQEAEFKRGENRTLCKAAWFFMEWNSTFTALQQRAEKLNKVAADILDSRGGSESFFALTDSAKTAQQNVKNVLSNVSAALSANTVFRASVLRDFYMAFESVRGIGGNFTFGHKNVARDSGNITEAEETFNELVNNFDDCKGALKTSDGSDDGSGDEIYYDDDLEEDMEETETETDELDNGIYVNDASADQPLHLQDGKYIETYQNLSDLEVNRTHLWAKVAKDAWRAIRAMNVSTFFFQDKRFVVTQNMWRRNFINLTALVARNCPNTGDSVKGRTQADACYNVRSVICGAGRKSEGNEIRQVLLTISNSTFASNIWGYHCNNVDEASAKMSVCTVPGAGHEGGVDVTSMSTVMWRFQCPVVNTAIQWLRFRFITALDFMKLKLSMVLSDLYTAEQQMKEALFVIVAERRNNLCALKSDIAQEKVFVDLFKERIAKSKAQIERHQERRAELEKEALKALTESFDAMQISTAAGESVLPTAGWLKEVRISHSKTSARTQAALQASKEALRVINKTFSMVRLAHKLEYDAEESVKTSSECVERASKNVVKTLGKVSAAYDGENISICNGEASLFPSLMPAIGISKLLPTLEENECLSDLKKLKNLTYACKLHCSGVENVVNEAEVVVNTAVKLSSEASLYAKSTVGATKKILLLALEQQKKYLCTTVTRMKKLSQSVATMRKKVKLIKESADRQQARALEARSKLKDANAHKERVVHSVADVRYEHERAMVAYSNLEKVVKEVLLKADAVAESGRNQIKMIRHTFADAVHNITLTPTAGEAEVCGDRSDYEVRSSLKVAMESVLALNSMPDATELQTMLHSMQENVNTAINIRNEAKKHADAAVVASLKAQQMEAEVVCAPLFEQLLRHVW